MMKETGVTTITIEDGNLVVEMHGIDIVYSTRHKIEYPLAHVVDAQVVTDLLAQSHVGWKIAGGYWPGAFRNGYFREHGTRVFWNVRPLKTSRAVAITLKDQDTVRLVLGVEDPEAVAAMINAAV
jgi:hypothetical protein